jgi:phosphate transport system substrate-binding protein
LRSPRFISLVAISGALAFGVAACGGDDGSTGGGGSTGAEASAQVGGSLNGAGATFPQPVYNEWAARIKDKQGTTVNYQGIGSGGGIAQFTQGTVDFGATDSAMDDDEVKAARKKGEPVHVPTVFGAVTVSYNLPGVDKGLKLDGATVADIFLGKVKKWNDPAIVKVAGGDVQLPAGDIQVCHRSDESGTTKLFTTFLAAYSTAWDKGPGVDKSVDWPTGTGAKGNDGVAACVKQNEGSIGYVEQAYALQNDFTYATLKNKAGNFVEPTLDSTSAAGDGVEVPEDLRFSAIDSPGEQAYPIASATFLLVYQDMCKAGMAENKAEIVKSWLDYAMTDGQKVAPELEYAPLPDAIHQQAQAKVDGLRCNGRPLGGTSQGGSGQ